MKSRIFTLFLTVMLASFLHTALADTPIDALFTRIKNLPDAEYSEEKLNKSGLKGAFEGVKSIEVTEASLDETTYQTLRKEIVKEDYTPHELLLDTQEGDELVKIFMMQSKKKVTEVVILELDKERINLVRFKGNLKSEILKNK